MRAAHTDSRRSRTRLAGGLALAVVATALGAGGATAGAPSLTMELPSLPAAETWTNQGLDPQLAGVDGTVRVRVELRPQPLLTAAASDRVREQLQPAPDPASRRDAFKHPGRITGEEKSAARAAERSYDRGVALLQNAAASSSADLEASAQRISGVGGRVVDRELIPASLIVRIPARDLALLGALPGVAAIDAAPAEEPLSGIGYQAVGAPSWWTAGFTGGTGSSDTVPADAGVEGELPDPTHPAFSGVTIDNDPSLTDGPTDHGTHTAGILTSNDATYRGVAHGLDRLVNGTDPFQLGLTYNGVPGAPDPIEVLSKSFGSAAASDNEDDGDDIRTAYFGISQAMGASNDNIDGSPTIGNIGRNTMSVGGYNDVGTVASTDDVVLGVSSRGPTPGGRKKPDLTAPGGAVIGPSIDWNSPPSNPDFTGMSGTSFSAPHVAGAMTLLEGAGITDPMAQRAILINSARDWDGTNTGLHGWTAPQTGWRPEVGWGELDLTTALAQRGDYQLGSVPAGEARFYRAAVPTGAKATMAFQLRGFFTGYPNPGTQTIKYTQSNLDLHQYRADGSEVTPPPAFDPPDTSIDPGPDAIDPNDTVEQVRAPAGGTQAITYKVEAASQVDGAAAEPFAIAAAAPLTSLVSPVVRPDSLAASPSGAVGCSTPVTISTTLHNDSSDIEATSAAVGIELPGGVQLVSGDPTQAVSGGTLETSSTSESHSWTVQATSDGPKTITVAGVGEGYGTPFRRVDALTLNADCVPPATSIDSGPSGPTRDSTPSFTFSAQSGGGGFECSVDFAAYAPCSSPFEPGFSLADGQHTFRVRAKDAVGNADPSPAERGFSVDTQPPDTSIVSGPSGAIASESATFAFTASLDVARYECSLDGTPFSSCSSPATTARLSNGSHTFAARALDAAGNVDSSPASRSFSIDRSVYGAGLSGRRSEHFNDHLALRLTARLGEPGRARITAKLKAGKRTVKAEPALLRLRSAEKKSLKLTTDAAGDRAIAKSLEDGRLIARVKGHFTDELGNKRTVKRSITLG